MLEFLTLSNSKGVGKPLKRYHDNPYIVQTLGQFQRSMLVAGGYHTLLLTTNGQVYVCGSNYNGQLGLVDTKIRTSFTLVPTPAPVLALVTGANHTLLLTTSGQVYACGDNSYGQLGLGDTKIRTSFTFIPTSSL